MSVLVTIYQGKKLSVVTAHMMPAELKQDEVPACPLVEEQLTVGSCWEEESPFSSRVNHDPVEMFLMPQCVGGAQVGIDGFRGQREDTKLMGSKGKRDLEGFREKGKYDQNILS